MCLSKEVKEALGRILKESKAANKRIMDYYNQMEAANIEYYKRKGPD